MRSFGETIKDLREQKSLPLRVVSAYLDIDQAILSKIERGLRNPSRDLVIKLAAYFEADKNDFLIAWLSDRLVLELENEETALSALQVAEAKMHYYTKNSNPVNIIDSIQKTLTKDGRVNSAWLFGSVARGEDNFKSDIDLMVELKTDKKYSMFDLLDIAYQLEIPIKRKVDLVEKDYLNSAALANAQSDLIKIYG